LHGQLDVWLASNLPTAVLYTDIDNFGAFAATHGQEAAERVIVRVAHLLVDALPHDNVAAAHLGGDRFMAILPPNGAKTIAQTVVTLFREVSREFYPASHSESPHAQSGHGRHASRPLSLSAVLVTNEKQTLTNYMQVSATLATLMRQVKEQGGDQAAIIA
ncbi:MAG: diguanylate cyclase domain-containing protein, partial [Rudaea sp.]